MLVIILLKLLSYVCAVFGAEERIPTLTGRIVGGSTATIEKFPFCLSVRKSGKHICGGSIITTKHVITAAHCTNKNTPTLFSVYAGSANRYTGGTEYFVLKYTQHSNFDPYTYDYDICILELSRSMIFSSTKSAIQLPISFNTETVGQKATCSGWGRLSEGGSSTEILQAVDVEIIGQTLCEEFYVAYGITPRMLCAGVPELNKDSCQGDSGGPLVVGGKLVGVVSWGVGCGRPRYPGVYTNVLTLVPFINQTIR